MNNSKIFLSVLALCLCIQIASTQQFPQAVTKYMATRQMRYHHYMWHQIRDNWNSFSSSTQRAFRNIGWAPTNPARDSSGNIINNNYAGEDFLYMHRQMIATAKQIATQNNQSTSFFTGWTSIPAPGDASYPVPSYGQYSSFKTRSYYNQMIREEQRLKDTSRLKRMTLNELGIEIETDIHNAMHLRWTGSSSVGVRGGDVDSSVPRINKKWDDVRYNFLADTYSSHVNPIFWRLHGWIDDRIEDWRKAHGLTSIRWVGTWTGGPMSSLGSVMSKMRMRVDGTGARDADPDAVGDLLEKAFEIFGSSGVPEFSLGDAIKKDHKV